MINRDSRGHSYSIVRGGILGFMKDEQLRKHLPRMFSLIKNESWGLEDGRATRGNLPGPDIVRIDRLRALSRFYGWWCMAVLSWWSDLSG